MVSWVPYECLNGCFGCGCTPRYAAKERTAMRLRMIAILISVLSLAIACKKAPTDPSLARMATILSKRISSVKSFDIEWVTTGTTVRVETGTSVPDPFGRGISQRTAFKSGKFLNFGRTGRIPKGNPLKRIRSWWGNMFKQWPLPQPDGDELGVMQYWASFLCLPKTLPALWIYRLDYDISERLASGKCKILDDSATIDGHKCLLFDRGPDYMWLDADQLVVRRTARKGRGQPTSNTITLSDYRPLKGTLLSIPWRVEMHYILQEQKTSGSQVLLVPVDHIQYWRVIKAFANDDVPDSIFSPFPK
jgi:hypothetical protein